MLILTGPSAVRRLMAEAETSTVVSLSWNPPRHTNGIVRSYYVCYSSEQNRTCIYDHVNTQRSFYWDKSQSRCCRTVNESNGTDVSPLHKWSTYVFSVRACTVTCGPFRNKTIRTKQDREYKQRFSTHKACLTTIAYHVSKSSPIDRMIPKVVMRYTVIYVNPFDYYSDIIVVLTLFCTYFNTGKLF